MLAIATLETLFNQAQKTAHQYFDTACDILDDKFGKGYAHDNPGLVGTMTQSMAMDFATTIFRKEVNSLTEAVRDLIAPVQ